MTILESIILGIVEGLTEYLPVSSTGHLIIAQYLLGIQESNAIHAFEICIQGGAILAVFGLYFQRIKLMIAGLLGKNPIGLKLLTNMIIAFIPAVIIGLMANRMIKAYLFNATTVMLAWAIGGLVILLYTWTRERSDRAAGGKPLEKLGWKGALCIGLMQCIAMCPGTSRSLMTMLGGLCVGLSISAAVEFSFLLGLITLGAATCHDAVKDGAEMVQTIGWGPMLAGTLMAWASALVAVKWMVGYLNRHSLSIFGWYRLAAAGVMLALVCTGLQIHPENPEEQAPTIQQSADNA